MNQNHHFQITTQKLYDDFEKFLNYNFEFCEHL